MLGRNQRWSCRLGSCEQIQKKFSVRPEDAGVKMVQFRVNARHKGKIYSYWAETDLPVFEKTKNLRDISIQVDKFVSVGGGSGKEMGNSISLNIDTLIKQDRIRNANDLIREYRTMQANYKMLKLTFDSERSEQLTQSLTATQVSPMSKRILQPERGSLSRNASLKISSKLKTLNIILTAKQSVSIGRSRKNDIVTRILPRTSKNDLLSKKIGGESHCKFDITGRGVFVKDPGSINGTFLDGEGVDSRGGKINGGTEKLNIGGVLTFSVQYHSNMPDFDAGEYEKIMDKPFGELWGFAKDTQVNSITFERVNNLDAQDENGREFYCLVYRIATIGARPSCSIRFEDKGLEPLHAAILYLGNRFYLENLSKYTDVFVNNQTLSRNELIPLSFGDKIRIAQLDVQFLQKFQLFLNS